MQSLEEVAQPGDLVSFYYSGHSSSTGNMKLNPKIGYEEEIVGNARKRESVSKGELCSFFDKLKCKVAAFLSTCYSTAGLDFEHNEYQRMVITSSGNVSSKSLPFLTSLRETLRDHPEASLEDLILKINVSMTHKNAPRLRSNNNFDNVSELHLTGHEPIIPAFKNPYDEKLKEGDQAVVLEDVWRSNSIIRKLKRGEIVDVLNITDNVADVSLQNGGKTWARLRNLLPAYPSVQVPLTSEKLLKVEIQRRIKCKKPGSFLVGERVKAHWKTKEGEKSSEPTEATIGERELYDSDEDDFVAVRLQYPNGESGAQKVKKSEIPDMIVSSLPHVVG